MLYRELRNNTYILFLYSQLFQYIQLNSMSILSSIAKFAHYQLQFLFLSSHRLTLENTLKFQEESKYIV